MIKSLTVGKLMESYCSQSKDDVLLSLSKDGYPFKESEDIFAMMNDSLSFLMNESAKLNNNREVVLWFVERNSHTLEYASEELRCDRNIVIAATATAPFGGVLQGVDKGFGDDPEVVLSLLLSSDDPDVMNDSLKFASDRIKNIVGDDEDPVEVLRCFIAQENLSKKIIESEIFKKKMKI